MTQFTRRDVSLCVPGEGDSHTLLFEARHNWTGLLVEPMVNGLLYKHRKVKTTANIFSSSQIFPQAHVALTCLATEPRPHYAHLEPVSSVVLAAGDTHTGAEVEC